VPSFDGGYGDRFFCVVGAQAGDGKDDGVGGDQPVRSGLLGHERARLRGLRVLPVGLNHDGERDSLVGAAPYAGEAVLRLADGAARRTAPQQPLRPAPEWLEAASLPVRTNLSALPEVRSDFFIGDLLGFPGGKAGMIAAGHGVGKSARGGLGHLFVRSVVEGASTLQSAMLP